MLESMVEWMSFPMYYAFDGKAPPSRIGRRARDHLSLWSVSDRRWEDCHARIAKRAGMDRVFVSRPFYQPELARDSRFASNAARSEARDELLEIIVAAFSRLSTEEVTSRLDAARIANARVNDMHAIWVHPQLAARDRWRQVDSPVGCLPALVPPGLPQATPIRISPIPALGEHTDKILAELGYDYDAIQQLRTRCVV